MSNVSLEVQGKSIQYFRAFCPSIYVMKGDGEECPVMDRIARGLCNDCDSMVPIDGKCKMLYIQYYDMQEQNHE